MLRLTHGTARNHQVMNPSVFGRTEAHMSHDRGRGREMDSSREKDEQSWVRHTLVPYSRSW